MVSLFKLGFIFLRLVLFVFRGFLFLFFFVFEDGGFVVNIDFKVDICFFFDFGLDICSIEVYVRNVVNNCKLNMFVEEVFL